jgi:hypothetical protein
VTRLRVSRSSSRGIPVTGIAVLFHMLVMYVPHRKHTPLLCYGDSFTFIYVGDVRTSQETYASTVCYGDSFTFIYVGDVKYLTGNIRLYCLLRG